MERAEWLKQVQAWAERLYNQISPAYWVTYGMVEYPVHMAYLQKFLARVPPGGAILSAGCGAGRYDGLLVEARHTVTGIDQSAGMLARAREHFAHIPEYRLRYIKMTLQDLDFPAVFDGVLCMDAMEHIFPEDYPHILHRFQESLKPGGALYFTVDISEDPQALEASYTRAKALGLPVLPGERVDGLAAAFEHAQAHGPGPLPSEISDQAVYHFYPSLEQVRGWIAQAGLSIAEEGEGDAYHHFIASKML